VLGDHRRAGDVGRKDTARKRGASYMSDRIIGEAALFASIGLIAAIILGFV
jgi:hypothetical protein